MEIDQIEAFVNRWKAVEIIEKEEALETTIEQRWRQLNTLYGMGLSLGLFNHRSDQNKDSVWKRWNLLRNAGEGKL